MNIVDVLRKYREALPEWLQPPKPQFDRENFFRSRTVYYPGAWLDAHPLELCNRAHAAHAFVYVDVAYVGSDRKPMEDLRKSLYRVPGADPGFSGYEVEYDEVVTDAVLGGVERRVDVYRGAECAKPFVWYVVLERHERLDDSHGARRFAVLFVGGDGFHIFQTIYCSRLRGHGSLPPFLVMIQDHDRGKYGYFGRGGPLERIAQLYRVYPEWLLVGSFNDGTPNEHWSGYRDAGAAPAWGGMHNISRRLYCRVPSCDSHA